MKESISEYLLADGDVVKIFFELMEKDQDLYNSSALVRAVTEIRRIAVCFPTKALILRGTADRAELATWFLDKLKMSEERTEYRLLNSNEVVIVFHLRHAESNRDLHEMVTLVRVLGELRFAMEYEATHAIAFRGTEVQVGLAEWLREQLDQPASSIAAKRGQAATVYPYPTNTEGNHEARVFSFLLRGRRQRWTLLLFEFSR